MTGLNMTKRGMIIIKPNKKFMKLANAIEIGIPSLSITNRFNSSALLTIEVADSEMELAKNPHGRRALKTKRGKCLISIFMILVKTKVITNMVNKGFIIAHKIPKLEPIYLLFKFFIAIVFIICLWIIIFLNLSPRFISSSPYRQIYLVCVDTS